MFRILRRSAAYTSFVAFFFVVASPIPSALKWLRSSLKRAA